MKKSIKEIIVRRCECENTGRLLSFMSNFYDPKLELPFITHKPNECKCVNELKLKDGKWLCSNCI